MEEEDQSDEEEDEDVDDNESLMSIPEVSLFLAYVTY